MFLDQTGGTPQEFKGIACQVTDAHPFDVEDRDGLGGFAGVEFGVQELCMYNITLCY